MKAVCIGLLWVLSVFFDGDWFVCCWNTYEEHPQLGCKDKTKITAEERVLIAKLKNKSMIIGLGILLAGFLVVSLLLPCGWKKCCENDCNCCDRKLLYDQMILEEEENVLTEVIRKAAKDKLTEEIKKKLGNETWGECFDVAEKLIEKDGEKKISAGDKDNNPPENKEPEGDKLMEESDSEKRTTKVKEAVRVKYREQQKYISSEGQLTYTSFLECVAKKFNILNLDFKVFDDSKTEVDEDVFDFLMKKQNLGVLEICQAQGPNPDDSSASTSFTSSSGKNKVDSDDTTLLEHSPTTRRRADDTSLAREAQPLIETVSEKTSAK